jgi:chaperonin GroES
MTKTLTPFNDRVIIKPIEEDEQMYGSIVVPDLGKERPEMGEVIAVGPGRQTEFGQFIRVNAKVGDIVLIPKIGSLRVDFEGEEYFITPDKEILASIKSEDNE